MSKQVRGIGEIGILWAKSAYQRNRLALLGRPRSPRLWGHSETICNSKSISIHIHGIFRNPAPGIQAGISECVGRLEVEGFSESAGEEKLFENGCR
jgi:hypothetical protein